MEAVEGKTEYDFGSTIIEEYDSSMPDYVLESAFVSGISYNYSGTLPGEASIRLYVGTQYEEGQVLYYSLMSESGTYAEVQAVKVDAEGYITVVQDHCSDYVITTVDPDADSEVDSEDTSEDVAPETGDTTNAVAFMLVMVAMAGMGVITYRKRV